MKIMEICVYCNKRIWFWQDSLAKYKEEHEPFHIKCAEKRAGVYRY